MPLPAGCQLSPLFVVLKSPPPLPSEAVRSVPLPVPA